MLLDVTSATTYAPPPIAALYERLGRLAASVRAKCKLTPYVNSYAKHLRYTTTSETLVLQIASEKPASITENALTTIDISNRLQFLVRFAS